MLVAAGVFIALLRGGGGNGSANTGGASASHQALSTPAPSVLASVVRHCDQSRPVWNGIKRPFANGPAVDAQSSGGYVALVSSEPRPGLLCMTAVRGSPYVPDGGSYDPSLVAPGSDQLTLAGGGFGGSSGAVAYDYGRVGRDVTAVEFIFRNHPAVEAVVHNGWYLAIWPEEASNMPLTASARARSFAFATRPTSVLVTTRSGTMTSPLPRPSAHCSGHRTCGVFDTQHPTTR